MNRYQYLKKVYHNLKKGGANEKFLPPLPLDPGRSTLRKSRVLPEPTVASSSVTVQMDKLEWSQPSRDCNLLYTLLNNSSEERIILKLKYRQMDDYNKVTEETFLVVRTFSHQRITHVQTAFLHALNSGGQLLDKAAYLQISYLTNHCTADYAFLKVFSCAAYTLDQIQSLLETGRILYERDVIKNTENSIKEWSVARPYQLEQNHYLDDLQQKLGDVLRESIQTQKHIFSNSQAFSAISPISPIPPNPTQCDTEIVRVAATMVTDTYNTLCKYTIDNLSERLGLDKECFKDLVFDILPNGGRTL